MIQSSVRRRAVVAASATVGALVAPVVVATSAGAAPVPQPTGLSVSPVSQFATAGGNATITASLTGPTGFSAANNVYFRVLSGPDATTGLAGTACTGSGTTRTCTVANTGGAGTDSIQVFYDTAGTHTFQTGDPAANATVTFAGSATRSAITPASNHVATDSAASYTITGTDVNGNPASGTIAVTLSQVSAAESNPLFFTDPTVATFPAASAGGGTTGGTGTAADPYTLTKTFTFDNGAVTIGAASSAAGTVTITAGQNTITTTASTASLTVSAGNTSATPSITNDDRASSLTLAAGGTSFINKTISVQATVKNAAGDPLGGVRVQARVAGPNAGATVTSSGITDQLGHVTLTYSAGGTAGSDTLTAWVNQDTNTVNTASNDPGEPQDTTTVTLAAEPAGLTLTDSLGGNPKPVQLSQTTTSVTYTLTDGNDAPVSGFTLNFAVSPTSTPANKPYTVSPVTGTTDAKGQVTVTVTNPAPADGDKIRVSASLSGDAAIVDNSVELDYQAATATNFALTPLGQTLLPGATVTETVKVTDQFNAPVAGKTVSFTITGRNGAATNPTSTGTCTTGADGTCSFSYTDVGTPLSTTAADNQDTVTASVGDSFTASATIYFTTSTTTAAVAVTASPSTTTVSANPAAGQFAATSEVRATVTNSAGELLRNKTVAFSSTGVGVFTDQNGQNATGTTATAKTDENGVATVYVRSPDAGTQLITASADGIGGNATVTYTAQFVPVTPRRIGDTRTGAGAIAEYNGGGTRAPIKLAPNTLYYMDYDGTTTPLNQGAYLLNVTAIGATGAGNLRVDSGCGSGDIPKTSLINYQPGKDVANSVIVPNSCEDNYLVLYSAGSSASVAIDLEGYYAAGDQAIAPVSPAARVVDTRTGLGGKTSPVAANTSASFQVAGVSSDVKAVAINVTVSQPTGAGNLRVYPDGATRPNTSNINYIKGVDKSSFAVVQVPANGRIDVYSAGSSANVIIDVFAYYPATSNVVVFNPVRIADTRSTGALAANSSRTVQVGGVAGVPANARAALVTLTGVHASNSTGVGNLRIFPAGGTLPKVSTLNYVGKTADVANFAIVKLSDAGQVTVYTAGSPINFTLDVVGYVPANEPAFCPDIARSKSAAHPAGMFC